MYQRSIKKYQQNTVASLKEASPHAQISAIFQHVLGNLAAASAAIERQDMKQKGETISKAIKLLDVLSASLDKEKGGVIAENLGALYNYCIQRLIAANIELNVDHVNEVLGIIREIKSGWDGIPEEYKNGSEPL